MCVYQCLCIYICIYLSSYLSKLSYPSSYISITIDRSSHTHTYITSHRIAVTVHYVTYMHYIRLHCVAFHSIPLCDIGVHLMHYIASHYITLHCISIDVNINICIYIYLHTCIHTVCMHCEYMYIHIFMYI